MRIGGLRRPHRGRSRRFTIATVVVIYTLASAISLALIDVPLASASQAPNLIGAYSEADICTSCGGSMFSYSWQITNENPATGSLSGTESSGGESGTLTGTITGTSVALTSTDTSGYTWYPRGTLMSDCSMSGTWTDSNAQSGTWRATPQSGQCAGGGHVNYGTVIHGSAGRVGTWQLPFQAARTYTFSEPTSCFGAPGCNVDNLTATVDWGDGSSSAIAASSIACMMQPPPGPAPGPPPSTTMHCTAAVSHTYADPGTYTVTMSVQPIALIVDNKAVIGPPSCPNVVIYGARGSGEDNTSANVGMGPVPYQEAETILSLLPGRLGVLMIGVNYPAVGPGAAVIGTGSNYLNSVSTGGDVLVNGYNGQAGLADLVQQCPKVSVVLIGLSQGAHVMHYAMSLAPTNPSALTN